MRFSYTALKDGKTIQGSADAVDQDALIASLNKQGAKPIIIKVESTKNNPKKSGGKVKLHDLVVFTRQLSTMISAGVPLVRSLSTLQSQATNPNFKRIIATVAKDIEGGMALGDAFEKHPQVFSDVYTNMVKAGEAGGILDDILKRLASQVEQDASMRKKIKSAMTYPVVILSITILAFFGIMLGVMPKIGKILLDLGGPDAKLPVYTQAMLNISDFMVGSTVIGYVPILNAVPIINKTPNALFIIAIVSVAIFFFKRYISTPSGKLWFHGLLLKTPILGKIIEKVAVARFARTFASLMGSGVGVLDALEVTGGAIGNKVIENDLKEASKSIRNGKQLSEPLMQSKHFPAIVSQMLAVGEETGQIDTILVKVADFYEEEVQTTIDGISSLIEPLMIVVLGGLVGIIAASVMGPIASLSKNISN